MALSKIRALHPEFFSDDDLAEVSIPARLLFAGMWCFACDNGHLLDKSKQIKRWIYATDDVNVAELLRELEAVGRITRADGWITIPNLPRRQKVDGRFFKTCEYCDDDTERAAEAQAKRLYGLHVRWHVNKNVVKDGCADCERDTRSSAHNETRSTSTNKLVVDGDGDGDGDGDTSGLPFVAAANAIEPESPAADAAPAKPKRATKRGTKRPDDWRPNAGHLAQAITLGIDPAEQLAAFGDYVEANGKTYVNWDAAFRQWLRNAKRFDRGGSAPRQKADADMFERMAQRAEARESYIRGEIA